MVNEISVNCYKNGTNVLPQRNSISLQRERSPIAIHVNIYWHAKPLKVFRFFSYTSTRTGVAVLKRSIGPRLFAALQTLRHLSLKGWWAERKPFVVHLIHQASAMLGAKTQQPVQRLFPRARAGSHGDVDGQPLPGEIRRQQDHIRFVRSHPIRKRA